MPSTPPERPVSRVLKAAVLVPLALAAGYVFLSLTLLSSHTDGFFAWRMSPVTATLLGGAYGGSCAMLAVAAREDRWVKVRVAVLASSLFMLLMLGALLLGRGETHLRGGALPAFLTAWIWLGVHLLAPVVGLLALGAQARVRGALPPRPPRLPWWVSAPMVADGTVLAVAGTVLYADPGPAARHWPWRAGQLDVRVIGAWCLVFGVALLLSRQEAELRRVRGGMAALVCTGGFGLLGLVRYADRVHWASPGAWLVVLVLCSLLGLGLSGVGVSALLDPPEITSAPPSAPVVRPA
ncbi:hypothetical protein P3T37_002886 [Kitasatospora sp. MAA4]|uniref:hypothetical protein n=1 Tax=Kitasatospora sp. MAA4 TaxID=3035093 RepID=UPI0024766990|nr:hypothetical protein [Kitasatospora sp. MAA4]MDH6133490.1 hypothetical protein [Kitasatospora sp. MAA4]